MNVRLDRPGPEKRFAETDQTFIRVDLDPDDIREFLEPDGFDFGDFHSASRLYRTTAFLSARVYRRKHVRCAWADWDARASSLSAIGP